MTLVTPALAVTALFFSRVSRAFVYLGIGTLRLDPLRDGIRRLWDDFNSTPEDAGAGLSPVEHELFGGWLPDRSRVLVVGSGSGRDLIALAEQGHRMSGVEPATRALDLSLGFLRQRGLEATVVPGFFEDVDVGGPFDAIIFSYFCYGYIPVSARRIQVLRKAAGLLAPGGRLLVSYTTMERPHPFLVRLAGLSAAVTRSDWRLEPGDTASIRLGKPARSRCFFFEHAFTIVEMLDEVAAAGLEIVHHRTASDYPWIVCVAQDTSLPITKSSSSSRAAP